MDLEKRVDAVEEKVRKHLNLQKFIWIVVLLIDFTIIGLFIRLNTLISLLDQFIHQVVSLINLIL